MPSSLPRCSLLARRVPRPSASLLPLWLFLLVPALLSACASAPDADWPARTVDVRQLRLRAPVVLATPLTAASGPRPASGTVSLRLLIDAQGIARKAVVVAGSGDASLDAATARSMVGARFQPYQVDGTAVPVTAVMPVRVQASGLCLQMRPTDC